MSGRYGIKPSDRGEGVESRDWKSHQVTKIRARACVGELEIPQEGQIQHNNIFSQFLTNLSLKSFSWIQNSNMSDQISEVVP